MFEAIFWARALDLVNRIPKEAVVGLVVYAMFDRTASIKETSIKEYTKVQIATLEVEKMRLENERQQIIQADPS